MKLTSFKSSLSLLLLLVCSAMGMAQVGTPYITRWRLGDSEQIEIPLVGSNYSYKWYKAGEDPEVATARKTSTWLPSNGLKVSSTTAGDYILEVAPEGVTAMHFVYSGINMSHAESLIAIEQWGSVRWDTFNGAYARCINMNFTSDAGVPDLSNVNDLHAAFAGCTSFNGPVGEWNVSNVKDIGRMFDGCVNFNQDLSAWDVRKVESMWATFRNCHQFDTPLSTWQTHSLTNLSSTFEGAQRFNQDISGWATQRVTTMTSTFKGAKRFNHPIGSWEVRRVEFMFGIFEDAASFDQPLGDWELAKVKEISFSRSGVSAAHYGASIVAWAAKAAQLNTGVNVMSMGMHYPQSEAVSNAIAELVNSKQWIFKDHKPYISATGIMITTPQPIQVKIGGTLSLTATVQPLNATNPTIKWSSNAPEIMGVDPATGLLSSNGVGTTTIVATVDDVQQSVEVEVLKEAVTGVTISPPGPLTLKVGASQTLTATVEPDNATHKTVTWSSNAEEKVSVDPSTGELTVKAEGVATITATADGVSSTVAITVEKEAVTGVTISPPGPLTLKVGASQTLTATVEPDNATHKTVTWSSNAEEKVSVDPSTGELAVKAEGVATITATADGVSSTVEITVTKGQPAPPTITSITITTPQPIEMAEGATLQLAYTVEPSGIVNPELSWSSNSPEVVSVDPRTGLLTAKSAGVATITATADGVSSTVEITVTKGQPAPPTITSITITTPQPIEMAEGATLQLAYTVEPSGIVNPELSWSSNSPEVVSVDPRTGLLTAKSEGVATITVAAGSVTQQVEITVKKANTPDVDPEIIPVERIELDKQDLNVEIGKEVKLTATVYPESATNKTLVWDSENPAIATVTEGLVKGLAEGTTRIVVKTVDGAVSATCDVSVTRSMEDITAVESHLLAQVRVYPNPFSTTLRVFGAMHAVRYGLYAPSGQLLRTASLDGSDELHLSFATLPSGIYLLALYDQEGMHRVLRVMKR